MTGAKIIFTIMASLMLLSSCEKIESAGYTIKARAVNTETTKTEMQGLEVYWSPKDSIGVTTGKSLKKARTITDSPVKEATFTVASKSVGVWYAFHPYNDLSKTKADTTAIGEISETQHPTMTSFDGSSDVLLSKPMDFGPDGTRSVVAEFKRLSAVAKIVLVDTTSAQAFADERVVSVSLKNGKYSLCGRSGLDLEGQCFKSFQTTKTEVTAEYSTGYQMVETNAAYLCVLPNTITNGYTIFTVTMESGRVFEKRITSYKDIPGKCFLLEANRITTFKLPISSFTEK